MNSIPAEKQSVLALGCLGTNVVGTEVYGLHSLESSQVEDFYIPIGCRPTVS